MLRRNFGVSTVKTCAALASALISSRSFAQSGNNSEKAPAKQSEYLFWLSDVDRQKAREIASQIVNEFDSQPFDIRRVSGVYQRGSPALKRKVSESSLVRRVQKYRADLGRVRERVFQGVEGGFRFLPGMPDGLYLIVTFDVIFQNNEIFYTEQITLSKNESVGLWEFTDYYLSSKPFYAYSS